MDYETYSSNELNYLLVDIKRTLKKILPLKDYSNFENELQRIVEREGIHFLEMEEINEVSSDESNETTIEFEYFPDLFEILHDHNLFTSWLKLSTQLAFHQTFPDQRLILGTYFTTSNQISIYFKYPYLDDFIKNQNADKLRFFLDGFANFEKFTSQEKVGQVDPNLLFFAKRLAAKYFSLKHFLDKLFPLWPELILTNREDLTNLHFTKINLIFQINEEKEKIGVNIYANDKYEPKMEDFQKIFLKQLKTIMLHASHLAIAKQIFASSQSIKSLLEMKVFDDSFNNITIVVHGGAGSMAAIPPELLDTVKFALFLVVIVSLETLITTENSLDTAERAVKALEDCFLFNAGKGSVHNCDGEHEMEATLMDGDKGRVGCVAGLRNLKNPIRACRKILENCRHIYLYGDSAEEYCPELERRGSQYFNTHIRYKMLEKVRQHIDEGATSNTAMLKHQQTVGAVVVDQKKRLAAATSTGGTVNKMRGRIGDSSVVGAGTFADKNVAVSTTGHGEEFLRRAIAARVAFIYEFSPKPNIAKICQNIVDIDMKDKMAGLIAVDKHGNFGAETNAKMFYGSYKNGLISADIIGHQGYSFVYKLF